MSARDEAIQAVALLGYEEPELVGELLDAAHASGAFLWADEYEQVGWFLAGKWHASTADGWINAWCRENGAEPVFRKRPQEPNE